MMLDQAKHQAKYTPHMDSSIGSLGNILITLWLFNIAMENGPFIDDFPIKTSIYRGFSMAMLNSQMVINDWPGIQC